MAIELDRIGWEDAPSEQTPLDSGNLKQMENNVEKAINAAITSLQNKKSTILTAYNSEDHTYNHTGSNRDLVEPILLGSFDGYGGGYLTYENNGITIGPGVKHVNIKASAIIRLTNSNQNGDIYISIRKNGNNIGESNFYQTGYAPFSYCMFRNYVPVEEGDHIQLYLQGANMDINILSDANIRKTQISVEFVD